MGGVHFVLVSDFYQLPPVLDKPLYSHLERGLSLTEANGRELYRSCSSFVELTEQMRQVGTCVSDQLFRKSLQRNRLGRCTEEDTLLNKQRTAASLDTLTLAPETLCVAPTREICRHINKSF